MARVSALRVASFEPIASAERDDAAQFAQFQLAQLAISSTYFTYSTRRESPRSRSSRESCGSAQVHRDASRRLVYLLLSVVVVVGRAVTSERTRQVRCPLVGQR